MGTAALRRIQYGKEVVKGTAVAATKMLPATLGPIKPDSKPVMPRESAGVKADAVRAYVTGLAVDDTITFDTAYFQCLPMIFSCGLKGGIVPTEQTVSKGDYLWDFTPSLTASNTQDSITLERGDDSYMVETEYCMFKSIKLSGDIEQGNGDSACKLTADYFGRQNTPTAFTPLTPQPSLTEINAKLTQLYIDPSWATVGTTEKTNTLRGFDLEIMTGLHAKYFGSGQKYFDTHGEGAIGFVASFSFEGNAAMAAIETARKAASLQVVRLLISGPLIAAGGKSHSLTIDLGGAWDSVIMLSKESNGNDLWSAVLRGYMDVTAAKLLGVKVSTNLQAI